VRLLSDAIRGALTGRAGPKGNELIIFNADCILPAFIITFEQTM
jgi:hypothetical protein